MANMITVLNTILAQASTEYQNRVPAATKTNIADVGKSIMEFPSTENEFLSALVNKVAMTVVHSKIFANPLSLLKKGSIPLGENIEEIFTNPATGGEFDATGADLLATVTPDVKVIYHKRNRQGKYKVTVSQARLMTAFTSYVELEKLLNSIINSLYSGDNLDEFILMKNLVASGIVGGKIKVISIPYFNDLAANVKSLVKAINTVALNMQFPTTQFNSYATINPTDTKPVTTWTPLEDQIILLRADAMTEVNMELLATTFNMSKADFISKVVPVDSFGSAFNCYALLCDKSFFQVWDNLEQMRSFDNGEGLYTNYIWHHWQTYSLSLFANAIAFCYENLSVKNGETEITTLSCTTVTPVTLTVATVPVGGTVTYTSSAPTVATVADGVITPVANGTCNITCKYGTTEKVIAVTVALA